MDCAGLLMLEGHRTTFTDAFTTQDNDRRTHLYYPGTSSILTPEQPSRIVTPCLAHLDCLIINEFEVAALAGRPIMPGAAKDIDACVANARDVLEAGTMRLIVVHFPSGSVAIARGTPPLITPPLITPSVHIPKDAIAGSNGACDAFACGILYGMHQSWTLDATLQLAHASAAASIRSIGTTDGIADWRECPSLAGRYGLRALPA